MAIFKVLHLNHCIKSSDKMAADENNAVIEFCMDDNYSRDEFTGLEPKICIK